VPGAEGVETAEAIVAVSGIAENLGEATEAEAVVVVMAWQMAALHLQHVFFWSGVKAAY
jgi:hypothetical protein